MTFNRSIEERALVFSNCMFSNKERTNCNGHIAQVQYHVTFVEAKPSYVELFLEFLLNKLK